MNGSGLMRLRLVVLGCAVALAAVPAFVRGQDRQNQGQGQGDRPGRGRGQGGPGGPGGRGALNPVQTVEQTKEQVNALTLKDDQKTKLDAIFKEEADKAKSLETEVASLEPRDRMQKIQPFARELREKVNGVLDEEQRQTLRKNMAARQGKQMAERWKQTLSQLNLTADQQTKVDAVLADAQKKMEAQAAEPADANAGPGGPGGRGGRFGAMAQETRQKIRDVLTADQQQKLDELMPQRGGRRGGQGGAGGGAGRRGSDNNGQ